MDLFSDEQQVYDNAVNHIQAVDAGEPYDFEQFRMLAKEYRSILKQLRRVTKFSDQTTVNLHESNLNLSDKVEYDTLTGIHSRHFMEESMEEIFRQLASSGDMLGVMMMDIDFFKRYNDTYGHSAGDDCLRAVAQAINSCVTRTGGFTARYGGEEFVAILPHMDKDDTAELGKTILCVVRELSIPHEKNEVANHVTISIGATAAKAQENLSLTDYIQQADLALYNSKRYGRNCYTYI